MLYKIEEVEQLVDHMNILYGKQPEIAVVAGIAKTGDLIASNKEGGGKEFAQRLGFYRPGDITVEILARSIKDAGHRII